jgi:uncharacterized protein (TIGR00369 family)
MATAGGALGDRVQRVLDIPLHRWLGLELAEPGDPCGGVVLSVGPPALDAAGMLHGGIVAALLDVTAFLRLLPELAEDEEAVTHGSSVSLLRPVPAGARLLLRADLLRKDSRLAFLRSGASVAGDVVAMGQVTKSLVPVR